MIRTYYNVCSYKVKIYTKTSSSLCMSLLALTFLSWNNRAYYKLQDIHHSKQQNEGNCIFVFYVKKQLYIPERIENPALIQPPITLCPVIHSCNLPKIDEISWMKLLFFQQKIYNKWLHASVCILPHSLIRITKNCIDLPWFSILFIST